LETFLQTERHITLSELQKLISDKNIKFDYEFISDTLKLMCRYGFARKHRFRNGDVRYEHMHLGQHHDHMVCVKCKNILEFEDEKLEQLQMQIASDHGFHVLQHRMELYGICPECLTNRPEFLHLSEAPKGERLIIVNFTGVEKYISRLLSVGLRIGDEVDVIVNSGRGQLVVALGHRRLILCRKFAQKIIVKSGMKSDS
jgi:Fur family ferric uptake transcriptional regulator